MNDVLGGLLFGHGVAAIYGSIFPHWYPPIPIIAGTVILCCRWYRLGRKHGQEAVE